MFQPWGTYPRRNTRCRFNHLKPPIALPSNLGENSPVGGAQCIAFLPFGDRDNYFERQDSLFIAARYSHGWENRKGKDQKTEETIEGKDALLLRPCRVLEVRGERGGEVEIFGEVDDELD
jgi:hypothetical protein